MDTHNVHDHGEIDADALAAVAGGTWENHPADTWRYRGLCWHEGAYEHGRIVLPKHEGFRYGVELSGWSPERLDAGILVSAAHQLTTHAPALRVDSVHHAIRRLAAHLRANSDTQIIAVTGSVGKTSACYLLRHLLQYKGRVTTNGQFNYPDGIVCEACNVGEVDYAVIEASLQGLGEATHTLMPQVALLTNISPVHIDLVGSLLALAEKKASLFGDLAQEGTAVINRDIPHFDRVLEIARAGGAAVLTFGEHADAHFQLVRYDLQTKCVYAQIMGEDVQYHLGLLGRHMALNSLGVLAAAHAAGAGWKTLIEHCASARVVGGRGTCEQIEVGGALVSIIDDAYNASPAAMEAAFKMLASTSPSNHGRRIAVLADMLELGDNSVDYHERLAEPLLASGVDRIYLAGELMNHLWRKLPPNLRVSMAKGSSDLLWPLVRGLRTGDVILLKGSHGTGMHELATDLRYLSLVPNWCGVGSFIFMSVRAVLRETGIQLPLRVRRWITWQLGKLMERRTRATT